MRPMRVPYNLNVRHAFYVLGISALALSQSATGVAQSGQGPAGEPSSGRDYRHDTSRPLRDIPPLPYVGKAEHEANRNPRRISQHRDEPETVAQTTLAEPAMPSAGLNFDGVGFPGVACNCAPPDTNGEVGATQYAQIVNEGLQVFNKTTGASVLGPVGIKTLWSGFGGVCENNGSGDPVLLYDQLANRWVVSQFAGVLVPTDECIAVSTTSDATGSYNRYAFHLGSNFFDYPKLAVWPDGYYMAMNVFNSTGTAFLGPQPFAFNRAAMLAGSAATFVTTGITGGSSEESYLPADLDGNTLPPAGAPNTFVEFPGASGHYKIFHFHADFGTPVNSTFTLFAAPTAAGYTELCAATRSCVPQSSTTSRLDAIGDRFMFRAAYRNFGDHEALVSNYTVSSSSVAGVRWVELRNVTNGPVTVFQESTYQPDSTWRWMGSTAMDGSGNLAVGFSASSGTIFPQIRYAGRLASDPLNTLAQGEATLFAGTGSQTGTSSRWGDYSALTIDPVDDCTFWYTTEYYATTTSFNWRTRVGTFKFPQCGGATGTLQGKVTDSTNGANISGALVQISGGPSTSTNSNGDYTLSLATGSYNVTFSKAGYTSQTHNGIQVTSGATTTDNASLVPSPAPQPPTGLAATPGNSQVGLTWNASLDATGYNVFRGTSQGGAKTKLNPSPVSGTSYNDTGVSNGTTYYYQVTALNGNGESGFSNEASATPTAPPAAPTNLVATSGPGKKKINLTWQASIGATSYNVKRFINGAFQTIATVTGTTYQNSGLANRTTYTYVVTAVNGGGESGPSNQASATTQ
jgi:Carboxypeptidase regulatory-like domain/Fibronectin type III domain